MKISITNKNEISATSIKRKNRDLRMKKILNTCEKSKNRIIKIEFMTRAEMIRAQNNLSYYIFDKKSLERKVVRRDKTLFLVPNRWESEQKEKSSIKEKKKVIQTWQKQI